MAVIALQSGVHTAARSSKKTDFVIFYVRVWKTSVYPSSRRTVHVDEEPKYPTAELARRTTGHSGIPCQKTGRINIDSVLIKAPV
jgi:hypothetical protein